MLDRDDATKANLAANLTADAKKLNKRVLKNQPSYCDIIVDSLKRLISFLKRYTQLSAQYVSKEARYKFNYPPRSNDAAITLLYNKMKRYHFINCERALFRKFVESKIPNEKIVWTGTPTAFKFFINTLRNPNSVSGKPYLEVHHDYLWEEMDLVFQQISPVKSKMYELKPPSLKVQHQIQDCLSLLDSGLRDHLDKLDS